MIHIHLWTLSLYIRLLRKIINYSPFQCSSWNSVPSLLDKEPEQEIGDGGKACKPRTDAFVLGATELTFSGYKEPVSVSFRPFLFCLGRNTIPVFLSLPETNNTYC